MWENDRTFRVEEGEGGVASIGAMLESWLEGCGEVGRIEDGLPQRFEGYVDGSDV